MSAATAPATTPAGGQARIVVSVVIVSYNTAELTVACLASLAAETDGLAYEVIVVDNASTDGSPDRVRAEFPSVTVIERETNEGFGRAVNAGAARARGEFLLLLNPDTIVLDRAVPRLVDFARAAPAHGLYGGRTLRADGTVDPSSCWGAPSVWSHICFGLGLSALSRRSRLFDPESMGSWQRDSVCAVGVVTGCLLLVRAAVWARLGGFDPRFFMYGEDVDLSLRARRAGWDPVITPEAVVVHHVGASSTHPTEKYVLVMKGKTTLARVHWSGWRRALCLLMLASGVALRGGGSSVAGLLRRGGGRGTDWPALWRRRAEWWAGYPGHTEARS